jgi:hypothetical protein
LSGTGPCQPADASALAPYNELYQLGSEIPIDSLVAGQRRPSAGSGRIVPLEIVGSDGSIQGEAKTYASASAAGGSVAWDNERGEMVSTSLRPGSRWFPTVQYMTGAFSDASCSVGAAIGPACGAGAKESFTWATDECGYPEPTSFYELGAPIADQTSVYYLDSPGDACRAYPGGAESPITNPMIGTYEVGLPVAVTAFAEAMEVRTGTGQIQIVQAGSAGGRSASSIGFFDTVHGQPCTFQSNLEAADGVVRCLPLTAEARSDYFADAACSVPLLEVPSAVNDCQVNPVFASVTEYLPSTSGCYMPVSRRRIHAIGDRPGHVYFRIGATDCLDFGDASVFGGLLRVLGPEIPASEFAALDYVRPN